MRIQEIGSSVPMTSKLESTAGRFRGNDGISGRANLENAVQRMNENLGEQWMTAKADLCQVDAMRMPSVATEIDPAGAKGTGELANSGTTAAVANAVFQTTRKRVCHLSTTIDTRIMG